MLKFQLAKPILFKAPTGITGSDTFPATTNEYLNSVNKICSQEFTNARPTNQLEDAFYEIKVENGEVFEQTIIEMATETNFERTAEGEQPDLSPVDPNLHVKYFNNWEEKQFKVTKRITDIRKALTTGKSAEEVGGQIVGSLRDGEGDYHYRAMRAIIENSAVGADGVTALGGTPTNMKGVIFAIRQLYNICKATNTKGGVPCKQGVDPDWIRLAISEKALALMDVTELANIFNLDKEQLMGKIVKLPDDDTYDGTKVLVYDKRALLHGLKDDMYDEEELKGHKYVNYYLNTEHAFAYCNLFKAFKLDISTAMTNAFGAIMTPNA